MKINIMNFFTAKNEKELKEFKDVKTKDKAKEGIQISGAIQMIGRDKTGKLLWIKEQNNLITNAGFDFMCDVLGLNAQPSDIIYMAIGSGVAGDATATTLTTEDQRELAVYAHSAGTKTCTFTTTFTTVVAATEYGLLNAAAAGTLLNIAGFSAITVDSLQIVATLTLS